MTKQINLQELVQVEELEGKAAPAVMINGASIVQPDTIIWDEL